MSLQWVVSLSEQYGVPVWNGESALHSDSGVDGLTNTFVSRCVMCRCCACSSIVACLASSCVQSLVCLRAGGVCCGRSRPAVTTDSSRR